ncbi:glycerophosphodiester phosphodiesterase family protein [Bacteroides sp.]
MRNFNRKWNFLVLLSGVLFSLQACEDTPQEPEPSPEPVEITIQCSPECPLAEQEVRFSASVSGPTVENYKWDFGDSSQSEEQAPVHIYATEGEYRVKLTVSNSSLSVTDSILVSVGERDYGKGFQLKWISNASVGDVKEISPVLSPDEDQIYIISGEQVLKKIAAPNGIEEWTFDLTASKYGAASLGGCMSMPSVDTDGTVYIGTGAEGNGKVFAINPDGSLKWYLFDDPETAFYCASSYSEPNAIIRNITCTFDNNNVYIGYSGITGSVISVSKKSGFRKGNLFLSGVGTNNGVTNGVVMSKEGHLYFISNQSLVCGANTTALKKGGSVRRDFGTELSAGYAPEAPMAVDNDNNVYLTFAAGTSNYLCQISSAGKINWKTEISNDAVSLLTGVVLTEDRIAYVSRKQSEGVLGGITAVDVSGKRLWNFDIPESVCGTPIIVADGSILFGTTAGNVYIIEPQKGSVSMKARINISRLISESDSPWKDDWAGENIAVKTSPVVAKGGIIYCCVGTDNGEKRLIAFTHESITGPLNGGWPMRGHCAQNTNRLGEATDEIEPEKDLSRSLSYRLSQLANNKRLKFMTCCHRSITAAGYKQDLPSNSLLMVQKAIENGLDIIEVDARATKDGVIVNMHDADIDNFTNGTGRLSDMTYQELQKYNLLTVSGKVSGSKVPTFEEVLALAKDKIFIFVDMKEQELATELIRIADKYGMIDQILWYISGDTAFDAGDALTGYSKDAILCPYVSSSSRLTAFLQRYPKLKIVHTSLEDVQAKPDLKSALKTNKIVAFANHLEHDRQIFPVQTPDYSYVDLFITDAVEIIQSDYSDIIIEYLQEKGYRL